MVYCYSEPNDISRVGWVKIGYTEKKTPQARIREQTHTAGVKTVLEWAENAMYKDGSGEYFTDHDFHRYLTVEKGVEREPKHEFFRIEPTKAKEHFDSFASRDSLYADNERYDYTLRDEQEQAVEMTKDYFDGVGNEFLWNAKPRFGKTLTTYDLIRSMGLKKVLVVTNRPSIANAWAEDFMKFVSWRDEFCFVSETDSLKNTKGVMSRQDYIAVLNKLGGENAPGMIAFESLQGLKGSKYFGEGKYDKLKWMSDIEFDLLVVDEAHEGVDTLRTEQVFRYIKRKYTLYLSGTPFKALADGHFNSEQIFNWAYSDEQAAKDNWEQEPFNPYEPLPRMEMYTYQMSNMIYDEIQRGMPDLDDDSTVDYAFDLNEFFAATPQHKFVHEEDVKKFLHALTTQKKYPFSTEELRDDLAHTVWILNRKNSVYALKNLLAKDPIFKDYKVIAAVGEGVNDEGESEKAYDQVTRAIEENDKTITLSVGQLLVGVTIPRWSGVLMLANISSPALYMQAAFRAQNPCMFTRLDKNGRPETVRKETAYVFDFDPARTLTIYEAFANNLNIATAAGRGSARDREENIKRLLNFFPVLAEDEDGEMEELNAEKVLTIPRRVKSTEVVRHGFMSNFLFANISNVFGAPAIVQEIVKKLEPAHEDKHAKTREAISRMGDIEVNEDGNIEIQDEIIIGKATDLFGPKIYEVTEELVKVASTLSEEEPDQIISCTNEFIDRIKTSFKTSLLTPTMESYDVPKGKRNAIEKQVNVEIEQTFDNLKNDFNHQVILAEADHKAAQVNAESKAESAAAYEALETAIDEARQAFVESVQAATRQIIEDKPKDVIEKLERAEKEEEKNTVEDSVRDHLRGFSRTIPSFIMAYGDGNLKLSNFDDYTEDDVFEEVTGITEDNFRFLRDGGDYVNPETGKREHFEGHLFDEVVFNDSIQEFLHKREELANYFDESKSEDIFDYIPPQKTNQIFTPRHLVSQMVDMLEAENPGCFNDPSTTFADLYMKSGLYITEIVKRLYNSDGLIKAFPNSHDRIRHILREQVYGLAPTRIIYLIAKNYILGFDPKLKEETKNFKKADAAAAAKEGKLQELVDKCFG